MNLLSIGTGTPATRFAKIKQPDIPRSWDGRFVNAMCEIWTIPQLVPASTWSLEDRRANRFR